MSTYRTLRKQEQKPFEVNIEAFLNLYQDENEMCQQVLGYGQRFLQAVIALNKFADYNLTFDMVDNCREYYIKRRGLFLVKTIRGLLKLNKIARAFNSPIFNEHQLDTTSFWDCFDLVAAFDRALWEAVKIDLAETTLAQMRRVA